MEHYKNLNLDPISEIVDGVTYKEEWRSIAGYEGLYEVSNFGRIKRLIRINCNNQYKGVAIKSQKIGTRGYLDVTLVVNGESKTKRVARIVGEAFIDNIENKPQINHKKGNKLDNRAFMLEWNTISENQKHSFSELGRIPVSYWIGKHTASSKPVICLETCVEYPSARSASISLGLSLSFIQMVCVGKRKSAKGLHFKYK